MARKLWIGTNMGSQSSGMNISYSSGSGRGTSGGVRSASGKGKVKPTLKGKLAEPSKASVKVKPAAKQQPGKKDIKTFIAKRAVRNEKINEAQKGDDFINSGIRPAGPFSDGKTKLLRQIKASNKKK
jgi:hypothetical protein